MDRYEGKTISLWDDNSRKRVGLINLHSGERFSFILKNSCVAGRQKPPCDIQITTTDRYISGRHFCFKKKGNAVYVEDLNSKNGTWINGKRISSVTCVHGGDILKAGKSEFKIYID